MWPTGIQSAVALTFDFDAESVWIADDPSTAGRPGVLSQGRYGAMEGVDLVLELLAEHDLRATFFVPGTVAEWYPEPVQRIVAAGHELGAHGYTHGSPVRMTPAEEEHELDQAVTILEGFGTQVVGYRSPSWDFSPLTLELLSRRGFAYSTNFMDRLRPYTHPGTSIIELPVQWLLDDAPHFWFSVADWSKAIAPPSMVEEIWTAEFEGIHRLGGATVFTMHPQIIGRPSRLAMLDRVIRHIQQTEGAWIGTCRELAASQEARS